MAKSMFALPEDLRKQLRNESLSATLGASMRGASLDVLFGSASPVEMGGFCLGAALLWFQENKITTIDDALAKLEAELVANAKVTS